MPRSLDLNPAPWGLYLWKKPIGEGNGSEGQEERDINTSTHITDSLHCTAETNTTL